MHGAGPDGGDCNLIQDSRLRPEGLVRKRADMEKGDSMILVVGGAFQGKQEFARELAARRKMETINFFHNRIQKILEDGEDGEAYIRDLLEKTPNVVIVMDEVGAGVVPVERSDREYRDAVGRAGQLLAREAKEVYRVICGIGVKIKG